MSTTENIKQKFQELSGLEQEKLLDELLKDYELRGQVLDNATEELLKSNKRKPCPHPRTG